MAKLTSKQRRKLPGKDFAVSGRKYPINDKEHAKAALARVSEFGTSQQKKEVEEKVHHKFPSMGKHAVEKNKKKIAEKKRPSAKRKREARKR